MNSKQEEAIKIFKEFGWEKATCDNVLDLPIGSSEQKKKALAGLKSGDWYEWDDKKGWVNIFGVNDIALVSFAIRAGVDASRAVSIMPFYKNQEYKMLEAVISSRGESYANRFIASACTDRYRPFVNAPSRNSWVAIALVHDFPLPVPKNAGYIKDWIACCAPDQHGWEFDGMQINSVELLDKVRQRFTEHVQTAVEVGASVTGSMKDLLQWGIKEKCISEAELRSIVFSALNTPIRPGDRKVWLEILDLLQVSDKELCMHLEELLPVLSLGEAAVINRLAPVFIANAGDDMLVLLLMACFSGTAGKTRRIVLEAALKRECPPQAEQLTEWLAQICRDGDIKTVKLAQKLSTQWNLENVVKQDEEVVHGYWQQTPPLWTVPDFSLGETTPEALTQLAAKLMGQAAVTYDVTTERFLAVANLLAFKNPEEVRLSLRGIRDHFEGDLLLFYIRYWVDGEHTELGADVPGDHLMTMLPARNYQVASNLGKQPCLLSTPSREDLSIRADDLLARLKTYKKEGVKALEADLYLAMTRLIPEELVAEKKEQWQSMDVDIVLQDGEIMPVTAGQAVIAWLLNPPQEAAIELYDNSYWRPTSVPLDAPEFPPRLSKQNRWGNDVLTAMFPLWGDIALMEVVHWDYEVNHSQGLDLRQAARHSTPFSADVMMNFLAAQRSILAQDAAQDSRLAVMEAWQRGLLQPGPVDIKKYDWCVRTPEQLAAFAAYLDEIAKQGLLSLVWSIADALILASCQAPRMFSGTAEMAELIRKYLPEAEAAVKAGIADASVLNLPGIRMLAARKGKSAAVSAAKEAMEKLPPELQREPVTNTRENAQLEPSFESIWTKPGIPCEVPDDGASIKVYNFQANQQSKKWMRFIVTLPNYSDCVFQIVIGDWIYSLREESQCSAYKTKPDASWPGKEGEELWLHWDGKTQKTVAIANRDWMDNIKGSRSEKRPVMPFSMVVISVGLLGQRGTYSYGTIDLLNELVKRKELDAGIMNRVMEVLLQNPDVNPSLMIRELEEDISLLPWMWPILTQSIRSAGRQMEETGKPPVWVNRILDAAIRNAPYLRQAAELGYIPAEDAKWDGLLSIANCKAKSAAAGKAKQLAALLLQQ